MPKLYSDFHVHMSHV